MNACCVTDKGAQVLQALSIKRNVIDTTIDNPSEAVNLSHRDWCSMISSAADKSWNSWRWTWFHSTNPSTLPGNTKFRVRYHYNLFRRKDILKKGVYSHYYKFTHIVSHCLFQFIKNIIKRCFSKTANAHSSVQDSKLKIVLKNHNVWWQKSMEESYSAKDCCVICL